MNGPYRTSRGIVLALIACTLNSASYADFRPPFWTITQAETDRPTDIYAADLDGDGDLDVLSASANDDTIAWYQNE